MRICKTIFWLCTTLALLLTGCSPAAKSPPVHAVPPYDQQGELVVLVRNGASSFYVNADGAYAGLEYDLVMGFAEQMGLKVKFIVAPRVAEAPGRLALNEAHLAVGLIPTQHAGVSYGPAYNHLQPVLVSPAEAPPPRSLGDAGQGVLMVASQFQPLVQTLSVKYPGLRWNVAEFQDSEELVEKVANRLIDYAVVERKGAEAAQNFYPGTTLMLNIDKPQPISWAWPSNAPPEFAHKVQSYFERIRKNGMLARILERYYGHINRLEPVDATAFLAQRVNLLPKYRSYFLEAEAQYGIDWRFLAALAYQESHWNRHAVSPYGVRGIMMLTTDTADRMGVEDRLDPKQSILGGAKYLALMKDSLPSGIVEEPDRTWFALAAYNIGLAHLLDARVLAQRLHKNPNAWADVKNILPLLRQYEYFSTLKYGYARGGETLNFVENIRSYYDILVRFEKPVQPIFPLFDEQVSVANPEQVSLAVDAQGTAVDENKKAR